MDPAVGFRSILFATDYSDVSQLAIETAAVLARSTGAMLYIVHVHEWAEQPPAPGETEPPPPPAEEMARLRAVVPAGDDVKLEHRLLHFRPPGAADVLVEFARQSGVDMIVVGMHGRSGLRRLLLGSVAEAVVRAATCPVLVVPGRQEEEQPAEEA